MLVKTVSTITATNTAGQVVESMPVLPTAGPYQDGAGFWRDPIHMVEDPRGVPIRIVSDAVVLTSTGRPIAATRGEGVGAYDPVAALGTDLLEFWDVEKSAQLTFNGSEVVTWASGKSGLAPTQATSTKRPTYNATGLNGRPCLVFDNALAQELTVGAVGSLPTGATTCEVWLLGSQDMAAATVGGLVAFAWGNGGAVGAYRSVGRVSSGNNRVNAVMGTGAADVARAGSIVDMSGVFLIRARMEASQVAAFLNGIDEGATAGVLGGTTTTRTRIGAYPNSGGSAHWKGKIAAIFVTNLLGSDKGVPLLSYFAARGGF